MRLTWLVVSIWIACIGVARADAARLVGVWRGEAVLNGDATPLLVEISACAEGICARLSMPELDYAGLPLGPVTEEAGAIHAGNLTLQASADRLAGTLAPHGAVLIEAMGHGGGPAQVTLARGRAPRAEFVEEPVTFQNGAVTLAGTLVRPRGRGAHPGIVAVLGSGPALRWYSLARARDWARLGYAVLIYDKRGVGASTGSWLSASLDDLADDATAALRFLQARDGVRSDRVGFWAHSQGGWVAPHAIARGAPAAFLISVSGGGSDPIDVERYDYNATLDHLGVSGAERTRANALVESYFSYLRGNIDYAAIRAALAASREAAWYRALGLGRVTPDAAAQPQWRWVATYDTATDLGALRVPVLAVLGGKDRPSLVSDAIAAWRAALHERADASVIVLPAAEHHMRVRTGAGWLRVSPAYEAAVENFLRAQAVR